MKIVHIIPSLNLPGGAETFCVNLAIALSQLGHQVTIITLYNDAKFYEQKLKLNKINYYKLDKHKGLDIINSIRLKKIIKEINPDVVHSHLMVYLSFFVGRILSIKNIAFFHTIHASLRKKDKSNFISYHLGRCFQKKKLMFPIAISHEVRKYYRDFINLNINIPIIYNGLPIKDFTDKNSLSNRDGDFICVANFSHLKNHISLLESFKKVIEEKPNTSLTLVGDGVLRENIKNKIFELKIENNVTMLGKRDDVSRLLSKHKYFILPSHNEGNPISVLEAMAAGLVILVTKHGGPVDVIIDRENGYLLDPFSTNQMTETMLECLKESKLNNHIQTNNLSKVLKYDILETAKQHIKLYASKIKNGKKAQD